MSIHHLLSLWLSAALVTQYQPIGLLEKTPGNQHLYDGKSVTETWKFPGSPNPMMFLEWPFLRLVHNASLPVFTWWFLKIGDPDHPTWIIFSGKPIIFAVPNLKKPLSHLYSPHYLWPGTMFASWTLLGRRSTCRCWRASWSDTTFAEYLSFEDFD